MNKINKEIKEILQSEWEERNKLRVEALEVRAEAEKLLEKTKDICARGFSAEDNKLRAKKEEILADADRLLAKSNGLLAKGNRFWAEAILNLCGNIEIKWEDDKKCQIDGEIFRL